MLEYLPSPGDVIAMRMSGKISGSDLDSVMDRVDALLSKADTIHLFIESERIEGIEIARLPSYIARALPLLGKLNRFGRVAVVADQAWVRMATRLESALLPGISYKTYLPEQRDEALAWAMGASNE